MSIAPAKVKRKKNIDAIACFNPPITGVVNSQIFAQK